MQKYEDRMKEICKGGHTMVSLTDLLDHMQGNRLVPESENTGNDEDQQQDGEISDGVQNEPENVENTEYAATEVGGKILYQLTHDQNNK